MTGTSATWTSPLVDLLFDEPSVGRCLVAPDGSVLRANSEWLRSTGLSLDDVLGADIADLVPEARDIALAMHARARAGHEVEVPRRAQRIEGSENWWEGSIAPVPMEGGTGLLITTREVRPGPGLGGDAGLARADAERALREAHERLRVHVETTPLALVEWDSEYRLKVYSQRAAQLFGWSADEVLGRRIDEIPWVPEEDWPSVRAVMLEMKRGVRRTNVNANRNVRKDGSVIYCEWYNSTFHDDAGRLVSVLSLVLDVTARKRAEEAVARNEATLAQAGAMAHLGAWWVEAISPEDVKGSPLRWSDEVYRIFGYEPGEVEVSSALFYDHVHPADRQRVLESVQHALRTNQPYKIEHRILRRDGTERIVLEHATAEPDSAGRQRVMVGAVQDITEQKRAELALEEANAQLRESDRRKDEFLGMLSHELRNPLAPIRNSVYILERADPTSEQAARARAVIQRQTEHLTRLVDDLLDVNRIARGKIELRRQRVDLREVVRRTAEDLRSVVENRGVTFRVVVPDEKVWANVDVTRLAQVIGNLLQNAAKFTRRGDTVTVSVRAADGEEEISVHDTGPGIDASLLPDIFEPFVQGERTLARTQGGLGLGLALVKGITELHGGRVRAESAGRGKGAEFVVRLPVVPVGAAQEPEHAGLERKSGGRRVLVVDDSADAAESLADIVRMLGHEVEVAYDGPSAIEKASANPPDIVLCDIGLPGMSGYEVAKALRVKGANGIQLVAVSGYAQPEDLKAAVEAGFDRHIAKPANPDDIERLLG